MKLQVTVSVPHATPWKRFTVSKIQSDTICDSFNEAVSKSVEEALCEKMNIKQKWATIRSTCSI